MLRKDSIGKKMVSKAFKHDFYSAEKLKTELEDMETSISFNSNCLGLIKEVFRFHAHVLSLSATIKDLELGTH